MIDVVWNEVKKWPRVVQVVAGVFAALLVASYGEEMVRLVGIWWNKFETYGHAFAVPGFSVYLLWTRREMLESPATGGHWWALPFFAAWASIRWIAAFLNYGSLDAYSLIPCLAGVTLWLGGWRVLRWSWPAVVFLVFMIPLPLALEGGMSHPLQLVATTVSVFLLQTLGIQAFAQGVVILLSQERLEVEQACNGLKMLMMFFTICTGAAFVLRGPLWEKLVIVASAMPIAVIANVARVTSTAIQREFFSSEWLNDPFHSGAGLAMMPLALVLLFGELVLLRKLFPEEPEDGALALGGVFLGMPQVAGKAREP